MCHLAGHAERPDTRPKHGEEPCFHLSTRDGERVACPFLDHRRKYEPYRRAARPDILVVNHHSFLAGRVPHPVRIDDTVVHKLPVLEMVLRRAGSILIDEIDELQSNLVELRSDEVELTSRRSDTLFDRISDTLSSTRGIQPESLGSELTRLRREVDCVRMITDELVDELERGNITWRGGEHLRWSGAEDRRLEKALYGEEAANDSNI
jgi:Rad3-related DNA helicase